MAPRLSMTALTGALALSVMAMAGAAIAQAPAPAPAEARPAPSKTLANAPAGVYRLDPAHTAITARVGHMNGLSYSLFRFATAAGTLTWDPARLQETRVDVTVDTGSIETPVKGFAERLVGADYLNAAKFPQARFVSTSVRRTGPTKARFMGELTLFGVTKPATFDIDLVGIGKSRRGFPVIGYTGVARFDRADFGFTADPEILDGIILQVDGEFAQR